MSNQSDQRQHKRLPLRTSVFVSGDSFDRFKTQTVDFSDGGLFVEGLALAKLKIDTIVKVQSAEGIADAPLLDARIAWTNRYGAGIQYMLED